MVKVEFSNKQENPFYGLRNCLNLLQSSGKDINITLLNSCWKEVKGNRQHREMFFSLLFSIGDITARQHNIFKGVVKDSGGNSNRKGFYTIFKWLRDNHKEQFVKFLNAGLFNEYQCFDTLFRNRVQTKGTKVLNVYNILSDNWYREELLKFVYATINGSNPFNKLLIAKFLTLPRLSKRAGHSKMLPETRRVMNDKVKFLVELSRLMGWEYEVTSTIANFKGYRKWRKEYNGNLESVLFSTGKIKDFSKDEFISWLDKLPAQARFRVKNRVLYSKVEDTETLKWPRFKQWFGEWEKLKEAKQAEQRVLEEKIRQGQASEEDAVKLAKIKKEAKVTIGATNFNEIYKQICAGSIDKLKLESFINKVNLPYNSLVIIDDSGSMKGAPFNFASFLAAVCLVKNPDDDGRNLLGFFNSYTHWHSYIDVKADETPNWMMRRTVAKVKKTPLVNPYMSFYENYKEIKSFCNGAFQGGNTNISAIPEGLHQVCLRSPEVLDALKAYPIWTIISDGEWNNLRSPEASLNDFMKKCKHYFGFRPFIVAIDIAVRSYFNTARAEQFSGIDNFMYIPSNPAQIEQFLTNFKDMDVFDVYTPLQSLYRSNRYNLVKDEVL